MKDLPAALRGPVGIEGRTIFLAGATGLAGSSIIGHVIREHPSTRIVGSYLHTEPFIAHERVRYVRGDLTSLDDCRRMARGADLAVMAAALTGGAAFVKENPWQHVNENIVMNCRMLEAFHREGIKRYVYIGSATLYQEFEGFIAEDSLDMSSEPAADYRGFGWGVRLIERLCAWANERFGAEAIAVRSANIYGPYAKFDPRSSNFIPAIIRKAVERMEPFEVWGSPDVRRDVIYASDFAGAVTALLGAGDIKSGVFNLGYGETVTVGEVVEYALKAAGHEPRSIEYRSDRPVTVKTRALDCTRIRKATGWSPAHSPAEGIELTTKWWQQNKDRWTK